LFSVFSSVCGEKKFWRRYWQDHLGLSSAQAAWNYSIKGAGGKKRTLSLDGRIDLANVNDRQSRIRIAGWMKDVAKEIGLPKTTLSKIKGVVFETRQGYKSKDSKRQNADIANASKAYAHLYIPVILLFSTQIDSDVAQRYRENLWLLLTGTVDGNPTESAYAFCRQVIGYDLADFFQRYSPRIKAEIEIALRALLTP